MYYCHARLTAKPKLVITLHAPPLATSIPFGHHPHHKVTHHFHNIPPCTSAILLPGLTIAPPKTISVVIYLATVNHSLAPSNTTTASHKTHSTQAPSMAPPTTPSLSSTASTVAAAPLAAAAYTGRVPCCLKGELPWSPPAPHASNPRVFSGFLLVGVLSAPHLFKPAPTSFVISQNTLGCKLSF